MLTQCRYDDGRHVSVYLNGALVYLSSSVDDDLVFTLARRVRRVRPDS